MEQAKLEIFDLNEFLKQVDLADTNHILFAKFVNHAEQFCKHELNGAIDEKLMLFRKIWLELEIINALVLDDWESEGKPVNWLNQWETKYKNDVQEVITQLRKIFVSNA